MSSVPERFYLQCVGPCPDRNEATAFDIGYGLKAVRIGKEWFVDSMDWHLVQCKAGDHDLLDPLREKLKEAGIHGSSFRTRKDLFAALSDFCEKIEAAGEQVPRTVSRYDRSHYGNLEGVSSSARIR